MSMGSTYRGSCSSRLEKWVVRSCKNTVFQGDQKRSSLLALTRIRTGLRLVEAVERISGKIVAERDLAAWAETTSQDRVGIVDTGVDHDNLVLIAGARSISNPKRGPHGFPRPK